MNKASGRFGAIVRHLKNHFIPHEGNRYHPQALKHHVLLGYSVVLILLKVLVIVVPIALPSSSLYSSAITPQNIIDLTNQTRSNLGLPVLKANSKLAQAAQDKANDMLTNQYFAHVSPTGATPWSWIAKAGYQYTYAGENLAVHFTSSEGLQDGWMASPTHRANIVHPKYTDIGVGVAMGTFEGFDTIFVAEDFGTPELTPVAQTPAPHLTPKVTPAPLPVVSKTPGQVAAAEAVPKPQPEPLPAPQPAAVTVPASTPTPTPVAVEPVVYDSSLKVIKGDKQYQVSLLITGATSVTLRLASQTVPLAPEAAGSTWRGVMPFDAAEFGPSGELLSVTAVGASGSSVNHSLVWLAPVTSTQQLYTFNEGTDKFAKFFGLFTIHNLGDSVRQLYLYFIVFLTAALLLNIFVKIRVQHVSVISHTMLVLALALALTIV